MSEYLTTKELAELLRLKERKVYDLAASGEIPCSRATGKLLFPRKEIEAWITSNSSGPISTNQMEKSRPAVILGSHDPLLDWALRESRCAIPSNFDGSLDGLERFARGEGSATGLHIFNPETSDWNVSSVEKISPPDNIVLIEWAKRSRGLITGQNSKIEELRQLESARIAVRQEEAGSQKLLEHLLSQEGIHLDQLNKTAPNRTETDAALGVLEGKADAAFGLASLAKQYGLKFTPLITERYDLLVDRKFWFEPQWQKFINFTQQAPFKDRAEEFIGYDISQLGTVHFNA